MKLADSNSRLGKKLGKWIHGGEEEDSTDDGGSSSQGPAKKRHNFGSPDDQIPPLEQKISQWFTDEEKKERPLIIMEDVGSPRKILVITYHRAILFNKGLFCRLQDDSDKVWRQFVSVHLTEGLFRSSLALRFFRYHDSLFYHNPYKDTSPYMEETDFKIDTWNLERLDKKEAQRVYSVLKDKELFWKEKRRQEHFEQLGSLNSKPPGGAPPKKG